MKKNKKNHMGLHIAKNSFVDEGEGVVAFPTGLVITDNSEQRNGTRYDIASMDLSEYKGQVTADHVDMLDYIIAKVEGVKRIGNQIIVEKIKYAVKENALARTAYNLLVAGFSTDFSIETYGPAPDDEYVYYDAKLVGLSQVVIGNNRNATVNSIVRNSLEQSKEDGLDVEALKEKLLGDEEEIRKEESEEPKDKVVEEEEAPTEAETPKEEVNNNKEDTDEMTFVTIKNSQGFPVVVAVKNAAGDDVEVKVEAGATIDVSEDQKEAVEKQIADAKAPEEAPKEENKSDESEKATNSLLEAVEKMMNSKFEKIEQSIFDSKAKEPEFQKDDNSSKLKDLSWKDRMGKQINAAWDAFKGGDSEAREVLVEINKLHVESLKEDGRVSNSMTIADFGNFVISREMLSEIEGCRNDYTALINATEWKETLSTQMAWLKRSGDINMQNVDFCDDGANGNLKPISEYGATVETADLEELAAVTPVCNAATRFLAADLLSDVAAGYRNDYDRKRAQLVIARLEQAVEENGNSVVYDVNPAVEGLTSWVDVWTQIATCTPNGTFIFSTTTYGELVKQALRAGSNGPLAGLFTTGDQPRVLGKPYIVVPDDLMPALNSAETRVFVVDGVNVTVNHAVFYANLSNFTGRTSGGLSYDLSTDAAYEDNGTVKSAYQRNELVLRGSFFRGGAIKDTDQVSGLLAPGVS